MKTKLQVVLIVSLKNAINAILTNATITVFFPEFMQWHTHSWWYNVAKVTLAVVAGREATIWGPQILAWTQSPTVEKATEKAIASQAIADQDAKKLGEIIKQTAANGQ